MRRSPLPLLLTLAATLVLPVLLPPAAEAARTAPALHRDQCPGAPGCLSVGQLAPWIGLLGDTCPGGPACPPAGQLAPWLLFPDGPCPGSPNCPPVERAVLWSRDTVAVPAP